RKDVPMKPLSEKRYLVLDMPTEEDARSDQRRLLDTLAPEFGSVEIPLAQLRRLYPLCRTAEGKLTVTLIWNGERWRLADLERGDTTAWHYGLAVDLGSTSV